MDLTRALVIEPSEGGPARVAILRELTVADVRRLLDAGGEISLAEILTYCPMSIQGAGDLSQAGLERVWQEFIKLNAALFAPGKPAKKSGPLRTRKACRDMDLACLALIEAGHVGIWSYPFRLYALLSERAK